MHLATGRACRIAAAAIALLAAAALALQYALLLEAYRGALGVGMATLRFFSYFTILSNLLVALATAAAAFGSRSGPAGFLARACAQASRSISR